MILAKSNNAINPMPNGKRFGRLTILKFIGLIKATERRNGRSGYLCLCDCGNTTKVVHYQLKSGRTRSCGCLAIEAMRKTQKKHSTTHGMRFTREHQSWSHMLSRCRNKKHHAYQSYGGRGITVCKRWYKFENFYKDMGNRPKNTSLDRINNNGNYEPKNCRWATPKQQQANTKKQVPWKK